MCKQLNYAVLIDKRDDPAFRIKPCFSSFQVGSKRRDGNGTLLPPPTAVLKIFIVKKEEHLKRRKKDVLKNLKT